MSYHVAAWLLHLTELCGDVASTKSGEHVPVFLRFYKPAVKKLSKEAQEKLRAYEPALRVRRQNTPVSKLKVLERTGKVVRLPRH